MVAADTNVLVYAEGVGDPRRLSIASDILDAVPRSDFVVPVQALGELFRVLSRRLGCRPGRSERSSRAGKRLRTDLAVDHRLQIFDAIILAASAEAGCRMLLSEDMGDGFVWRGVTVVNPFAETPHPLLVDVMRS